MHRRTFLLCASGLAATLAVKAVRAQSERDGDLRVAFSLGTEAPDHVLAILREEDAREVHEVKERGLGGMETIVSGFLLARGLGNVVGKLLPQWQCGIVVDARGARIRAERNCDLPAGTLRVINPDGTRTTVQQPSSAQVHSLIDVLGKPK